MAGDEEFLEDWEYDKKYREEQERYSGRLPHGADRVKALNALTKTDRREIRSVEDTLSGLRNSAQLPASKRDDAYNALVTGIAKAGSVEAFNRKQLRKADSGGENFNRLHPSSSRLARSSKYDFGVVEEMRGNQGTRFEFDQRFDPPRSAGRIRDAAGSMNSDARTRADLFGGQGVGEVDDEWMLAAAKALINAVKQRRYARGRV